MLGDLADHAIPTIKVISTCDCLNTNHSHPSMLNSEYRHIDLCAFSTNLVNLSIDT